MPSGFVLTTLAALLLLGITAPRRADAAAAATHPTATPLFPVDGVPAGWTVRSWANVAQEAPPGARWEVKDGVLRGSNPRGTWLVSTEDHANFVLEFEFRLGERGNGGVGLRFPPLGEPSSTGIEIQLVDPRYYGTNYQAPPNQLTGAIFPILGPTESAYLPTEWNRCTITCQGPKIVVLLNGKQVLEVDLEQQRTPPSQGRPLAERPRRGRIGFQEMSRGGGHVEIREARLRQLD